MSDMKCPICNEGKIITYLDGTYECDNAECSIYNGTHTETFEALIRTYKALEVAIMGLKNCKTRDHIGAVCRTPEYIDKILGQIDTITKGGDNE